MTVVSTNQGGRCGYCLEDFEVNEHQLTHAGGKHDGWHPKCLKNMCLANPTFKCPYDQTMIDQNSLVSRTERVIETLKPAFLNAAYATALGLAAGAGIAGIAESAGMAEAAVAAAGAVGLAGAVVGGAAVAAGIVAGAVGLAEAEAVVGGAAVAGGAAGAVAGAGAVVGGAAVVMGANLIFDRLGVSQMAREHIYLGLVTGSVTTLAIELAIARLTTIIAIPQIALVAGVTAGVLSCIRR